MTQSFGHAGTVDRVSAVSPRFLDYASETGDVVPAKHTPDGRGVPSAFRRHAGQLIEACKF
jgi:hypothetical protein